MTTTQTQTSRTLFANVAMTRSQMVTEMEGPTNAQARKMAARRLNLLAQAEEALAAGQDERAFDLDCDAMDIEMDLTTYGFKLTNGRPV